MGPKDTSHKDRVNLAIKFQKPDRTPRDFAAAPEVWSSLAGHFGTCSRKEILQRLDVDCRIVSYDSFCHDPDVPPERVDFNASQEPSSSGAMWRAVNPDGTSRDIWGAQRRKVVNSFGSLDQIASHPLAGVSMSDLRRYRWPQPDWWDFGTLRAVIDGLNDSAVYSIRYRVGSIFETAWSLCGLEEALVALATESEKPLYILERVAEVHRENLRQVLEVAGDLIDLVYFYDDLASQKGLLLSPGLYTRHIQPFHQQIIDIARRFGKPVMMHSCGSVYSLIPRLIDMGVAVLNPVQPSANNMQPEKLAEEFSGRIAFHGGIDVQQFLPTATREQVRQKVQYTASVLGQKGGYICAGSHHIQSDTPLENVLAMFEAT
jgi:uroporphyrinogen decarboxylase